MLAPLDVRTGVLPPGPTGSLTTVTDLNGRPCDLQYSARLFASSSVCRPRATPEKETIWNSILPCAICTRLINLSRIDWSNNLRAFLAQSRVSCQSKNTTRLLPIAPRSWRARINGVKSILPPGARIAAPALPLEGTAAVEEVAFGGCGGGVGGVDTGVAGGDGFGDADLWAFGAGRSGLGGTTIGGCLAGGLTLLGFCFCFSD